MRALALLFAAAAPLGAAATPDYGQVFPADNPWNIDISHLPAHANSANYVTWIGSGSSLHPDFGTTLGGQPWGIPYVVVPGTQPKVAVVYTAYGSESDPGPMPIPANAPVEGGLSSTGDRHVLTIDRDAHVLYELFSAYPQSDGSWQAAGGAIFDLTSNAVRPAGWTSADAAGLPIFPGLARYDEVAAGAILHALRFTVVTSQRAYLYPARHYASSTTNTDAPPMGLRFRLKAGVDISGFATQPRIILTALKRYGMMVADNGGNWFVSGAPDPNWDDAAIDTLKRIHGSDFEAVDTSSLDPAQNTAPPAKPSGLGVTAGSGQATLTWTANTDADLLGYHVERAPAAGGPWTRQTTAQLGTPGFTQSGLTNGTTYWYRVIAEDYARNLSTPSSAVSVTPSGSGTTTTSGSTTSGTTASGSTTSGGSGGTTGSTPIGGGGGSSQGGCGLGSLLGIALGLGLAARRVRRVL